MYKCVYVAPVPVYYYYFASIILASFYTQPGALYIYCIIKTNLSLVLTQRVTHLLYPITYILYRLPG